MSEPASAGVPGAASAASATPRFRPRDLIEFRGYQQASIAWILYGTAIGAVFFVVSPLLAGMLPDVRWSLAVVSNALLVRGLLGIVTNPLTGVLIGRFGIRPVTVIGGVTTAACTALVGTVSNPWVFGVVFGVALTLADSFLGLIPATTVVHRWFMARRGVVMGCVNSGGGFGGLVFAPLMAVLVTSFGWRHALFALALIILVLSLPSVFLRDRPADVGQWVDGVEGRVIPEYGEKDAIGTVQSRIGQMARRPLYWMVFFIFGAEAWALSVYASDQGLFLKAIGVGSLASSSALGFSAGIAAVAGILLSRLNDKVSPYYVIIGSVVAMLAGSILFLSAHGDAQLWAYAFCFGAGYGTLVPAMPVAMSRYFGARNFAGAFGLGQILVSLMAGVGPWLTGVISDSTGSFTIPIYLITGLLALALVVAIAARPRPRSRAAVATAAVPAASGD
jgi:MFS family permease